MRYSDHSLALKKRGQVTSLETVTTCQVSCCASYERNKKFFGGKKVKIRIKGRVYLIPLINVILLVSAQLFRQTYTGLAVG